ncbi:MAG TPA: PspC domain-containing protein [Sphingomicrobium sp.]|nr:PspC domain-containing protein [Sphingomicrobium sp.]
MHAADTAKQNQVEKNATPLPLRNDTMLGVCTGLGEEFGFNPTILRVVIASLFLVSFKYAIGIYLALGFALAIGRLLFRTKRAQAAKPSVQPKVQANDAQPVPETVAA